MINNRGKQVQIVSNDTYSIMEVEHRFGGYGLNKSIQPHEWKLICMFYQSILVKNPDIAYIFLDFIKQYYSYYRFSILKASLDSVLVEANCVICYFLNTLKIK